MHIRNCEVAGCCRLAVHDDGGALQPLLFIREKDEQKVLENFFSILADLAKKSKGKSKVFTCRNLSGIYRMFSVYSAEIYAIFRTACGEKGRKRRLPARQKRPGARCCSVLIGRRRSCRRRDRRHAPRHRCGGSPPPAGSSRRGRRGNTRPRALAGARPAPPVSR